MTWIKASMQINLKDNQIQSFTLLLQRHQQGESELRDQLLAIIYDELRRLAGSYMARERSNHTLQPTALVNEAWIRFSTSETNAKNKAHFMALAAGLMKEILIDHARKNRAAKRGGHEQFVTFQDTLDTPDSSGVEMIEICDAIETLRQLDSRQAQLVDLRIFGGLSFEEAAEALNVSLATIKRDWLLARAWLYREMT